jgi:hypothetical protein
MKSFFKYFFISGAMAFFGFLVFGLFVFLIYPSFTPDKVLAGAVGCMIGTGLVNGFFAAIEKRV